MIAEGEVLLSQLSTCNPLLMGARTDAEAESHASQNWCARCSSTEGKLCCVEHSSDGPCGRGAVLVRDCSCMKSERSAAAAAGRLNSS